MLEQETKKKREYSFNFKCTKILFGVQIANDSETHHPNSAATQSQDTRRNPS